MDDELSVILGEIYRMIRDQREAHFQIQKMATATLRAMRTVPGFEEQYGMEWASESKQLDGLHAEAMQMLDQIILRFER